MIDFWSIENCWRNGDQFRDRSEYESLGGYVNRNHLNSIEVANAVESALQFYRGISETE